MPRCLHVYMCTCHSLTADFVAIIFYYATWCNGTVTRVFSQVLENMEFSNAFFQSIFGSLHYLKRNIGQAIKIWSRHYFIDNPLNFFPKIQCPKFLISNVINSWIFSSARGSMRGYVRFGRRRRCKSVCVCVINVVWNEMKWNEAVSRYKILKK